MVDLFLSRLHFDLVFVSRHEVDSMRKLFNWFWQVLGGCIPLCAV